ncbi:hypothetical protein BDZ91DRAFT_536488 [Kalaharituber pfeilii]|nr:hypothetical protein BDZ91DRAFT_536488 [Kalaharituber pfeilii]
MAVAAPGNPQLTLFPHCLFYVIFEGDCDLRHRFTSFPLFPGPIFPTISFAVLPSPQHQNTPITLSVHWFLPSCHCLCLHSLPCLHHSFLHRHGRWGLWYLQQVIHFPCPFLIPEVKSCTTSNFTSFREREIHPLIFPSVDAGSLHLVLHLMRLKHQNPLPPVWVGVVVAVFSAFFCDEGIFLINPRLYLFALLPASISLAFAVGTFNVYLSASAPLLMLGVYGSGKVPEKVKSFEQYG